MGAENKRKSQYGLVTADDVTSSTRIDLLHGSPLNNKMIIYGDLSGAVGTRGLLYKIWSSLFNTWSEETVPDDDNVYVSLGAAATYRYVVIRYTATRGSKVRGGMIEVLNTGVISQANDSYIDSEDDDSWLVCSLSVNLGSQIQIKLTADDSDETDTTFKYRIVDRIEI